MHVLLYFGGHVKFEFINEIFFAKSFFLFGEIKFGFVFFLTTGTRAKSKLLLCLSIIIKFTESKY